MSEFATAGLVSIIVVAIAAIYLNGLRLLVQTLSEAFAPLVRSQGREAVSGEPESELERRFIEVIRFEGLEYPIGQYWVRATGGRRYRLDFAYPRLKLAIETDGIHHLEEHVMAYDERRTRELNEQGWIVVRFDWKDVTRSPEAIGRVLRAWGVGHRSPE